MISKQSEAEKVFAIIAEEVGIPTKDLTGETEFADLGVDDFLSKSILSKIAEQTTAKLPPTTFFDFITVNDLQSHLDETLRNVSTPEPAKKTVPSIPAGPLSILLQGKPTASEKTIFLLPDGSGSGMAYSRLPAVDPSICVIALNSPYLNAPKEQTFTVEGIAAIWAQEIQRRQPEGPYILGGWSAGGYYSFEVTKCLTQRDQRVSKLILIDSPCRVVFEELPMEVVHYLSKNNLMGNWGTSKPPAWMVNHFDISIRAISHYVPTPMEPSEIPDEVFVIWAKDGVLKGGEGDLASTCLDLNVKVTRMLIQRPESDGPLGWDGLFPSAKLNIANMPGNHFTIVYPPNCNSLSMLLNDSVQDQPSQRKGEWH